MNGGDIFDLDGDGGSVDWESSRLGARGGRLARLKRAGLPVPDGFIIEAGHLDLGDIARTGRSKQTGPFSRALGRLESRLGKQLGKKNAPLLLAVRQSPEGPRAGLHPSVLNVGFMPSILSGLVRLYGERRAHSMRCQFLQGFACTVFGADPERFESARAAMPGNSAADFNRLSKEFVRILRSECGVAVPNSAFEQLRLSLKRLSRPRTGVAGLNEDDSHAILIQEMAQMAGGGVAGSGSIRIRDENGAKSAVALRFSPSREVEPGYPVAAAGEWDAAKFGNASPEALSNLKETVENCEDELRDALEIGFVFEGGALRITDAIPLRLSARGEAALALEFVKRGILERETALLRIDPLRVEEMLHARIDPAAARTEFCRGIAASPGAASGRIVFSASAAEQLAAYGDRPVLAKTETDPADVGAMHVAAAMLTSRGGTTSHAAVVARGLGRPCVTGVVDIKIDADSRLLRADAGGVLREGDEVTVDGAGGVVYEGTVPTLPPDFGGPMAELLEWADDFRRMKVRANADTTRDARLALEYRADGVGLCRTEHMFFAKGRITAMREVILAETEYERRRALERLRPMQHDDFLELFIAMHGRPVVVRLLDPPLHEFLPHGEREMSELADAMGMPVDRVMARAAALEEFNPMLGNRGCRVGIAYPEIYEMQARAILEAAYEAGQETGDPAVPEIMVPLVSAQRELEILKGRVDAVAEEVASERGGCVTYLVGAMIETPRAALRADAITEYAQFLSFGTNDLTQMAYGLSRDDAGRFMPNYLRQGVFAADPFVSIDREGVGELIEVAVRRARAQGGEITLGLCGEHGADPASLEFCEDLGIDYVSCSPFRLPVARLAAAQATIRSRKV